MRNNLLIRCLLRRNLGAAVLGTAISTMNTVIDSFLMGNLLGADALSAINLSLPLSYALVTVQCIMASGASLLVSKKLGERQTSRADEIFTVSLASLFIAGLALTLLAPLIANPIAGLLCNQTSLMENCRDYCRAELFCALPIMFQIALSSFAQRTGNPKLVLKANLASLAVNIAMDVWYVSVLRLGMTGAALATGTGAITAVAVVLADFARKKPVRLRWPKKGALGMLLFNMGSGMTGTAQTVSISVLTFESLQIDRRTSFRIRLCVEEMLDFIAIRAKQKNDIADVRIVATEREVSVLLRDNLPPYNPLVGEDCQTNRKILQAFCPKMDYQNTFLQNVVIMDWNDLSRRL